MTDLIAVRRNYRSATATPSQDGSDDCRRTLQPLQASGGFFDKRRGTRPVDLNWGRYLAGWSSRILSSLRKFLQEPRGVLTVSLRPGPSCVVAHEQQRSEGKFLDVGKAFGVQRNV
jgi:hypothetical protein